MKKQGFPDHCIKAWEIIAHIISRSNGGPQEIIFH